MKALIIIDIQNDFLPGGALEVPESDKIIPVVNKLQEHFELVVATQDWHPANHKSFASNHKNKQPFDIIELGSIQQILWPDHCVQGTAGADFPESLNMNAVEAIVRKGTDPEIDSYSGFYDNGHLKSTGLADYLKGRDIHQIFLVGLCADICVSYTALDGIDKGFKTYIIEEGTCPLNKENYKRIKEQFLLKGGKSISASAII
jgi:nicotinamidase/pyrazinamidase